MRVELTEAGRSLIADVFPRHAADIARAMAGVDASELAVLDSLLRKIGRGEEGLETRAAAS